MQLTPEQWSRVVDLFDDGRQLPRAARESWLARAAPDDGRVRDELRAMLALDDAGDAFLAAPVVVAASGSSAPYAQAIAAGTRVGPWRVSTLIGRGGMGEVYGAERADGAFQRDVALKVLKRGLDTDAVVRRFLRERRILARLRHPNIAELLDAGSTPDGRPWLVMERVHGRTIGDWCATDPPPAVAAILGLVRDVCDAVHEAHRNLVVHRDLKPSNVLVTERGTVKLLDFGVARLLADDDEDATRTVVAAPLTPAFAAPEQFRGEAATTATDVYALGALLYLLLCGRMPRERPGLIAGAAAGYEGVAPLKPSVAVLRPDSRLPRSIAQRRASELSGDLDLVIAKAMHHDPERRYRSAAELAQDIDHFLALRPVLARPDTLRYRIRQFVRRNRAAVAAAALALSALVGGLGIALWGLHSARIASAQARAQGLRAERVKGFLVDVFRQADPTQSLGETISARQLLEQGARQLRAELTQEPAVQAELYGTLAAIYQSLGDRDQALSLAAAGLELQRRIGGPDDPLLTDRLLGLADIRDDGGEADATTLALVAEAQRIEEHRRPPDLRRLALVWNSMAVHEGALSNRAGALALWRRCVDAWRSSNGPDAPETLDATTEMASVLDEEGRYVEAESTLRDVIARLERHGGHQLALLGRARLDLGGLLDRLGRTGEAEPQLREGVEVFQRLYGEHHPAVAEARFSYALLLQNARELVPAEVALREVVADATPGGVVAAHAHRYLGIGLMEQGRDTDAVPELEAAVRDYQVLGPSAAMQEQRAVADLAVAHVHLGEVARGETELRGAIAALERLAGPDAYELLRPRKRLGEALTRLGRYEEAAALLRGVRADEIRHFGTSEHREVALTDCFLAHALRGEGTPAAREEGDALAGRCERPPSVITAPS